MCTVSKCSEADLFTNISRSVQQTDMLSVLDWPDQLYKRFALSPDEASEIIAIWGLALVLLSWVLQLTRLPDWASKTTMSVNGIGPEFI